MTTAFVLSGGGSLGSVQAGMLIALAKRGIAPDLLVGTSVGAVNAAWLAGHPGIDGAHELANVWRTVRRADVFPSRPLLGLLWFTGRRDHLVSAGPLRTLLRRHLTFDRLEHAPIPLHVVATDITTGAEVLVSEGDALDAVAASAAIPGVFPPVLAGGRVLVDGGVSNNVPIAHAIERGATTVYVLPTGYACALGRAPKSALGVALQSISLLLQQRLAADIARFSGEVDLRVLPTLCPLSVSPIDFSHSNDLIVRSATLSSEWLDRRDWSSTVDVLTLHRHT
jgi:NTE family protein